MSTSIIIPQMTEAVIHFWAFWDAACAPAMSPIASLPLTLDALTIATMPNGRQQKSVARMAPTM